VPDVTCYIPRSLERALKQRAQRAKTSAEHIVQTALAQYLDAPFHTLFQVSTSGALVAGVFDGVVTVEEILRHGDFGLGTFSGLDGEMVVLDGMAYQVRGNGTVVAGDKGAQAPFAVVTFFAGGAPVMLRAIRSFEELTALCDDLRGTDNMFYALRVDGRFGHVHTRAVSPPIPGAGLKAAADTQPEFDFHDIVGTLVGIWSPPFSKAFSVEGYHFHFISADRSKGGHLLACEGSNLTVRLEPLDRFHLSLPEAESFLKADLTKDPAADLAAAEGSH
jgi:acetolactate decarboxylase